MKTWKHIGLALAMVLGLTATVRAQAPAVPAAPAAPPKTLWSFLGISKEQKAKCKEKFCKTQIGILLNNMTAGPSMMSGGLLPRCCPGLPTPADLAKGGAEGAAAAIKADEAAAKERRAAVRFLSTVDCHYWPEAGDAMIAALRTDRNECVRWEAAMAMGSGCCCTKKTITALLITANGSDEDSNPYETSERVKAAAFESLQRCLCCYEERVKSEPEGSGSGTGSGEKPPMESGRAPVVPQHLEGCPVITLTPYYTKIQSVPMNDIIEASRQFVGHVQSATQGTITVTTGKHSVFTAFKSALAKAPARPSHESKPMQNTQSVPDPSPVVPASQRVTTPADPAPATELPDPNSPSDPSDR